MNNNDPETVIFSGGPANGQRWVISGLPRYHYFAIAPKFHPFAFDGEADPIPQFKKARYRLTPWLQDWLTIYEFEAIE